MKKEWVHPFWENAAKDRLTVRLNITHDDGSYSTSVAKVSKYDIDGKITSDYEEVVEQNVKVKLKNKKKSMNLKDLKIYLIINYRLLKSLR